VLASGFLEAFNVATCGQVFRPPNREALGLRVWETLSILDNCPSSEWAKIGGRFDTESFASSDPAEEQIYLQEVWILDEAGRFVSQVERSRGIIIMKSEIRAVEFFG
jgi:hypothetical protein